MDLALSGDLLARGCIHVTMDGRLVSVTLNRPDARNAQTPATWQALAAIGAALQEAPVDIVVIRGAGTAFSAGLDRRMFTPEGVPGEESLASLAQRSDSELAGRIAEFQEAFLWQRRIPALTVAAVHGPAIGAGFQLALACDVLIATPAATFAMRETSYGLVPDLAGTQPLVRSVGYARALELSATGRMVDAAEGLGLGFVTRIVQDLDEGIADLAAPVTAAPAGAVGALKSLLQGAEQRPRDEQAAAERAAQVARLRTLVGGA